MCRISSGNSLRPRAIAWNMKFVILYVKYFSEILMGYFINNRFAFSKNISFYKIIKREAFAGKFSVHHIPHLIMLFHNIANSLEQLAKLNFIFQTAFVKNLDIQFALHASFSVITEFPLSFTHA